MCTHALAHAHTHTHCTIHTFMRTHFDAHSCTYALTPAHTLPRYPTSLQLYNGLMRWADKYGPIVRYNLNNEPAVLLSDPADIRQVCVCVYVSE